MPITHKNLVRKEEYVIAEKNNKTEYFQEKYEIKSSKFICEYKTYALLSIRIKNTRIIINNRPNQSKLMISIEEETKEEILIQSTLKENIQLTQLLLIDLIQSEGIACESMFNSQNVPSISLSDYLQRIHKFAQYSPECLIIAIILIDRYNMSESTFSLNWNNVHRLLLTCILLAVKFQDDIYFDNVSFERGGGVGKTQLILFELEVFQKLDFSIFVDQEQYQALFEKLKNVYVVEQ